MSEDVNVTAPQKNIFTQVKYFILHALNPIFILEKEKPQKWYLYLIYPAVGWMIFFLQVGIDKSREFFVSQQKILFVSLAGLVIGYVMVGLIGVLLAVILKKINKSTRVDKIVSIIALSHTYMLFSVILGLLYSLLGTNSSTAFGVAGILCTLTPLYAGIRTLGKGRSFLAPILATLVAVLLLLSWQLIMIITF